MQLQLYALPSITVPGRPAMHTWAAADKGEQIDGFLQAATMYEGSSMYWGKTDLVDLPRANQRNSQRAITRRASATKSRNNKTHFRVPWTIY